MSIFIAGSGRYRQSSCKNPDRERLYTYAHLKSDEDKSNQFYLGLQQRALDVYTRASEMASFMTPEIQSMPDEVVNRYLADEALGEYTFYLEKIP